ncbi:MAG: carbohydrate porin [Acidobacteria bacterium]|nr:carbohydrate porin [Acidobacteriota bacterium]
MRNKGKALLIALVVISISSFVFCQESSESAGESNATESWSERTGIGYEAVYWGEFWANTRGGLKRDQTHLHQIDLSATVNTKQAGLWNDGKFFVRALSNQGGALLSEEICGDTQVVSNIEAPSSTRLYELWYEHLLFGEKLSLLLGIHDLNSEFAVTEYGGFFINSSFGISKEISGGGRPGIFPLAAPAFRARFSPNESWEFLMGVYNGDPGDPAVQKHFPRLTFNNEAGALVSLEASYHFGRKTLPGTVKAGYWNNTGRFDDLLKVDCIGTPIRHKGNQGVYFIADQRIHGDENRGLGAFLQIGVAPDEDINEFNSYIGAGLKYKGLIPLRPADEAGIAFARTELCGKICCPERDAAETALEISYRAAFGEHLALQPDFQFVFNPGADSTIKNAVVVGARLEIFF